MGPGRGWRGEWRCLNVNGRLLIPEMQLEEVQSGAHAAHINCRAAGRVQLRYLRAPHSDPNPLRFAGAEH